MIAGFNFDPTRKCFYMGHINDYVRTLLSILVIEVVYCMPNKVPHWDHWLCRQEVRYKHDSLKCNEEKLCKCYNVSRARILPV